MTSRRSGATNRRRLTALGYGLLCHTTFALGVGSMMAAMYFGMSRSLGTFPSPWSWLANAFLLLQFPLIHSLLLTTRGRRVLDRLAPGGAGATLSTTTYATVASVGVLALFALWTPSGVIWWRASGAAQVLLTAAYAASWLLLGKAMADAGLSVQTGSLGWRALFAGRQPVYPPMPVTGRAQAIMG